MWTQNTLQATPRLCEESRAGLGWGESMSDMRGLQRPSAHPHLLFLMDLSTFLSNATENVLGMLKSRIAGKTRVNLERAGVFTIASLPIGKEAFLSNQMGLFVLLQCLGVFVILVLRVSC